MSWHCKRCKPFVWPQFSAQSFLWRVNEGIAERKCILKLLSHSIILRTVHEVLVSFGCLGKNHYLYSSEQSYTLWTSAIYWMVVTSLLRDICPQNLKSTHADICRNLETLDKMYIPNSKQRSLHWHWFIQSKTSVATVSEGPRFASNQ